VSSGNQARTLDAHSAWEKAAPPGTRPAAAARPTYLRTVLRSRPRARAIRETLSPACQCLSSFTTSTTANILLAIRAPSIDPADGGTLCARTWRPEVGNCLTLGVANYLAPPLGNHLALEGFYPGGLFGRRHACWASGLWALVHPGTPRPLARGPRHPAEYGHSHTDEEVDHFRRRRSGGLVEDQRLSDDPPHHDRTRDQ
jgi:hypothetical protein